jgi:Double zinc ribbon
MNCPQCDREHDAAAKFCRGCGTTLASAPPTSNAAVDPAPAPACAACAAPLTAGAKFCKLCGASTVVSDTSGLNDAPAEPPLTAVAPPVPRPISKRFVTDTPTAAARGKGAVIVVAALVLVLLIGAGVTWRLLRQDDPVAAATVADTDTSKSSDAISVPSIIDKTPPETSKPVVSTAPPPSVAPAPAFVPAPNETPAVQKTPAPVAEATVKAATPVMAKPKPPRASVATPAAPAPMKDVALNLVRKGEAAFSQQDYSTAIANARAALDIDPGLARARQLLNEAQGAQQHAMNSISIQ